VIVANRTGTTTEDAITSNTAGHHFTDILASTRYWGPTTASTLGAASSKRRNRNLCNHKSENGYLH
jgi:hypothetical protein